MFVTSRYPLDLMHHHAHTPTNRPAEDPDALQEPVSAGERAEELLARAVATALTEGTSWSQIGARLGVPPPTSADGGAPTDRDWQNAIADHENTRAQKCPRGRNQHRYEHRRPNGQPGPHGGGTV
ncbi:hypothetical protein ACWEK5_43315 [Rhodococcus koreensis]